MKNQDILKLLKDIFIKEKIKDYTLVLDKKLHIGNGVLQDKLIAGAYVKYIKDKKM